MTHLISIDHRGMVSVDGEPIGAHVTRLEEITLRAIMTHDRVATRDYLLGVIYGGRDEPEMKILDVYVTKLRAKLGVHRAAIQTVWGRGYCRGADYALEPEPGSTTVSINAKLIDEVSFAVGSSREEVVEMLLKAKHKNLWDEVA